MHVQQNGVRTNRANATKMNGSNSAAAACTSLTADPLYQLCLEAKPVGGQWFSRLDTATRFGLACFAFCRFLCLQPISLLRFAYAWNTLWWVDPLLRLAARCPAAVRTALRSPFAVPIFVGTGESLGC